MMLTQKDIDPLPLRLQLFNGSPKEQFFHIVDAIRRLPDSNKDISWDVMVWR